MNSLKYADFKGPAKQLEDLDLPRIAHAIGAGEDEVHMLMDVESAGDGFDSQGRPKLLFEPHIMFKELTKRGDKKALDAAIKEGVAYKVWKTKPYPKDSYPNLLKAMKINPEAALMSASWGAEQMMGFNYKTAGYANVFDMVNAHCDDEENHIQSMINFCVANNLADDLKRLAELKRPTTPADTAPIARVYNGSAYAENNYHTKLATAHNKWRKIPDTPWNPDAPATAPIILTPTEESIEQKGLDRDDVRAIQQLLKDKGYIEVGKIDGVVGKDTISAVTSFEVVEGLPVTGQVTHELWERLKGAKMRPVSEERANASTQEVVENTSPPVANTVKQASLLKNVMIGVGTVSGLGGLVDGGIPDLDKLAATVNKTQLILNTIGDKLPWIIGLGAAGIGIYVASGTLGRITEGFKKGTVR